MRRLLSFRSSIRKKILLLALGLALPPLILVGWMGLRSLDLARDTAVAEGTDALRAQAESLLERRVRDKASLYDTALTNIQQQVENVARYSEHIIDEEDPPITLDRVWVSPDGPTESNLRRYAVAVARAQSLVPMLTTAVKSNPLVNIGYVGLEEGGVLAFNDERVVDTLLKRASFDARTRPWYVSARINQRTIWTDAYVDANTLTLTTTCATPIYDIDGEFIGVVGFDVLLQTIQQDLLNVDLGQQGYAFLVNAAGEVVVRPDMEAGAVGWNEPFRSEYLLESPSPEMRAIAQRMLAREQGVARLYYNGASSYIAFAPITTAGWSVALVIPADEIVQPAIATGERIAQRQAELRAQLLTLLIFFIAFTGVMGVLLAMSLTRPIRALQQGAQMVANGRLDYQLPAAGRDEIGQLVQSFNAMTVALREKVVELEQHAHQLANLNDTSNQLKAILDLPSLFETIAKSICTQFGFDRAAVYLVNEQQKTLHVVAASFGAGNEEQARRFITVANNPPISLESPTVEADIVRSGKAVIVNDPWNHPRVLRAKHEVAGGQSYVQVPIFGRKERVIGLLAADYEISHRPVTPQDASQLLTFANMVGLTIENARLYGDLERQVGQRTEELRAALDQAQLADRRKSDFLAAISHELRTPLNAIIGFSTVLLDDLDGPLTPTQREDIQSINRNGRFLLHLINELLDLARIEAGHLELDLAPLELEPVVTEVIDTVQALLRGRDIMLHKTLLPDLPPVQADAGRVRQILLNLLSNAVKFTERGTITVGAQRIEEVNNQGQISQYIAVAVRDTGIGIPLEHQGRIFAEFSQVHGQRSRIRGSGLGLSIARQLVEAHGGRIWVDSKPNIGSTFTFTIPVATQPPAAHNGKMSQPLVSSHVATK